MYKSIQRCRVCGNTNLTEILDLGVQALTGVFPRSREEKITSGPLKLVKCTEDGAKRNCGLVQLMHSYDLAEMYGDNYGYRSGLNASMVNHLHDKVHTILKSIPVSADDLIIDIGSNDSTLLQAYPKHMARLLGIDPTGQKFKSYYPPHIKLIPEFFSSRLVKDHADHAKAKIITSIAMFYDLESPIEFMKQVYDVLADDGLWVFEQSYMPTMLKQNSYDTICHEHLEYYGLKQIKYMTDRVGFKIVDVALNSINGGSISITVSKARVPSKEQRELVQDFLAEEEEYGLSTIRPYYEFRDRVFSYKEDLRSFFAKAKTENRTILGYGASTKGNVILQFCQLTANEIPYIAEVNEDKYGRFTPGTRIPIISEESARAMKPDYFMVLPWHFKDGIIKRENKFLAEGGMLVMPLPRIEVIEHDAVTTYRKTEKADTLIFIPTYNEKENVERLCTEIILLGLNADILFVDDNSPDGTGRILDGLKEQYPGVHVLHRPSKMGIGSAHMDGIAWAYEKGYAKLITMDSDFTHSPDRILELLQHANDYDIVLGSRYMKDNSLVQWNIARKALTHTGHALTQFFLKMDYDATGALRIYRLDRVPQQAFSLVHSTGYSFLFESLYILHLNGFSIKEVPINLPVRTYGHSKMSYREALRSVRQLVHLYLLRRFNKEQLRVVETSGSTEILKGQDVQAWDGYWRRKADAKGLIYDLIAAFYRKYIIRPSLNHFIRKYYSNGARLLHAGCGSGQVDREIGKTVSITALDVSVSALSMYRNSNANARKLVRGDILHLPLCTESIDGVFNLGVMEHFTLDDIKGILAQFRGVVKPSGKIILFWPPRFGLSVMFLQLVHFLFNKVLRQGIELHPKEITHVRSKGQVNDILKRSGLTLVEYYFGVRDLYTHAVVVAEKAERNT